jgi:hypothetical protein
VSNSSRQLPASVRANVLTAKAVRAPSFREGPTCAHTYRARCDRRFSPIAAGVAETQVGGISRPSVFAGLCRVEVDHQLELGRLHDRKVRGLRALEDASGVDAG